MVYDRGNTTPYGIIVLDAGILTRKRANEWTAWKINSMFRPVPGSTLNVRAIIEEEINDSRVNAIRFILLHEIGHILGVVTGVHPSWLGWQAGNPVRVTHAFPRLSWKNRTGTRLESLFDDRFPERKAIKAYAFENADLIVSQIPATYANLVNTSNFPTLYACENLWEDFADSFATYFHVVIDQRPWQIIIEQANHPDRVIGSCWGQARCREKELFLKDWFENPVDRAD